MQYLVFEYVEKNLLEVLEEHPGGLALDQFYGRAVKGTRPWHICPHKQKKTGASSLMQLAPSF
eukprot:432766-Pelagomonas_calceolata.AAC.1